MSAKENSIATIGIIITDLQAVEQVNAVLHDYTEYFIGRMGLPHRGRNINIITVVLDAPEEIVTALSGKIAGIDGVAVRTLLV